MTAMCRLLLVLPLLAACTKNLEPDPNDPLYADTLGDAMPGLDATRQAAFDRGREMMFRAFRTDDGLGPTFNADSCQSCHQFPAAGGSSPRYRDYFLVRARREDGALVDVGSNGASPVRNLYATNYVGQVPEPADTVIYARRNAPPFLGVGLFTFVPDSVILSQEDPDDADGDGISGRANYEQNRVGRFGLKAQANNVESFNRGAMINQMGITSDPLFADFPESPQVASLEPSLFDTIFGGVAHAQVSAPGEPTTDDDGVPDPEMSDSEQMDLLTLSVYLSPPKPQPRTAETRAGARLFDQVGCTRCHVPYLDSTVGRLYAYTDLLIHDMGEEDSDGFKVSLAEPTEFRTQPLWGVALHAPYLHDGSAETLQDAIDKHGGEGKASRTAYGHLSRGDQDRIIGFLESLGPFVADGGVKITPESPPPAAGTDGGPEPGLTAEQTDLFEKGEKLFDHTMRTDQGLGPVFNADSCRACHQDPKLGGAGGIDVNVLRVGHRNEDGTYTPLPNDMKVLFRQCVPGDKPVHLPAEANVIETRQPPSLLGLGAIDRLPDSAIEANADPDDADGDGISGIARTLPDGRLGRFGWKAAFATEADFLADALGTEVGLTVDPSLSTSAHPSDDDDVPDPEVSADTFSAILFYLEHLGPPVPVAPDAAAQAAQGQDLFTQVGCAGCHLPDLSGIPAYSDFLLHDVADPSQPLVNQDPGVLPTEYRTPPLWGVVHTAPYMHSGMAPSLDAAIRDHTGEADDAARAYEQLSPDDEAALVAFLKTL